MKKLIWILAPLLLVGVPLTLWLQFGNPVQQSAAPVAREEGQRKCPVPLPKDAVNVQYAIYTSGPHYQCFIRCEAPVEECIASIDAVFSYHAVSMKRPFKAPEQRPIHGDAKLPVSARPELNISWFDIAQIQDGVVAGEGGDWEPMIWVDKTRGIFYFYLENP